MKLSGVRKFGPIEPFNEIEIGGFSVVTGLNGAGKSQFLKAIRDGAIDCDLLIKDGENYLRKVTLLTNNDEEPVGLTQSTISNANEIMSNSFSSLDRAALLEEMLNLQGVYWNEIAGSIEGKTGKSLAAFGMSRSTIADDLREVSLQYLNEISGLTSFDTHLLLQVKRERLADFEKQLQQMVSIGLRQPPEYHDIPLMYQNRDRLKLTLQILDVAPFASNIVNVFKKYRDIRWKNLTQVVADELEDTAFAYTEVDFRKRFGNPPWETLTAAFQAFDIPYEVVAVPLNPLAPASFRFRKCESEVEIGYSDLSTGERVLVRTVLASFHITEDGANVALPTLLLMDELDASLHPKNVRKWLASIKEGFVDKLGVACILTTHSPTTVALFPTDSIWELGSHDARLRHLTKQRAVDQLTADLPMISIDISSRRQVFTESQIDMKHFEMLQIILRKELNFRKTLTFVGTGTQGGCDFVYRMTKLIAESGNRSVFGIVDWDRANEATDRVVVLADGSHYAKENVMLDPLLLGALLLKKDELKIDPPIRYPDLMAKNEPEMQRLTDHITSLMKYPAAWGRVTEYNQYLGGIQVLVMKGHNLASAHSLMPIIKSSLHAFSNYTEEGLVSEIIESVIADFPFLCPTPIATAFLELANNEL